MEEDNAAYHDTPLNQAFTLVTTCIATIPRPDALSSIVFAEDKPSHMIAVLGFGEFICVVSNTCILLNPIPYRYMRSFYDVFQ
jgi:hypothetical protein